jgi:iron(III) transport system ATP-binding protein
MFAVKINDLSHSINNYRILKNINIELEKDKIACILGPSGCGKTTLLKLIAGLEKIKHGEILLNNTAVSSSSIHLPTEKRKIGFLFQDYALFPHLTVKENLNFAINNKEKKKHNINEIIEVIKLPSSLQKYPHELSGGEQQRVALARSIISQPDFLLLDEPFSSLDLNLKEEIRDDTLHLLQKSNVTVLIVTHDPFEAMFISNKIYIMKKGGEIVQSGTPKELYNNPINSYVAGFFGETNKFKGVVKNSQVETPIGNISGLENMESKEVEIHVRPQGIKLQRELTPVNGVKGTVMASRLMGSYSFVHISVLDKNNEIVHVHSHMPPTFSPIQSSAVGIEVDKNQVFVFPV